MRDCELEQARRRRSVCRVHERVLVLDERIERERPDEVLKEIVARVVAEDGGQRKVELAVALDSGVEARRAEHGGR
jgi:hypothetical protein